MGSYNSRGANAGADSDQTLLVGVRLAGKKVVVVGGQAEGWRGLGLLVRSGADVHVVASEVTPHVEAMAGITLHRREYRYGDLDRAWYAIAADRDPAVNAAV